MIEHSTGNRKVLGSIPSGVEAFLFSQKKLFKYGIKYDYKYCRVFLVGGRLPAPKYLKIETNLCLRSFFTHNLKHLGSDQRSSLLFN